MTKAEYTKYLQTATWRAKRAAALKRAGYYCQLCCRAGDLQVHHRTYKRVGGKELAMDLTVLCRRCHKHFHKILTPDPGKWQGTPHICQVCGKNETTKARCRPCRKRGLYPQRKTSRKTLAAKSGSAPGRPDAQPK